MPFHPHPLFLVLLGLAAGTLVPPARNDGPLLAALGLAAALAVSAIARPGRTSVPALIVAAAAAGAALAGTTAGTYGARGLPDAIADFEGPIEVDGLVGDEPRIVEGDLRFTLEASSLVVGGRPEAYSGRFRVVVRRPGNGAFSIAASLKAGDRVAGYMDLRRPEPPGSPGAFDQRAWAMREGLHGFATCKSERLLRITPGAAPRSLLAAARARLARSWLHVRDPEDRAVTASMVLGDDGALEPTTREEFRAAGLLHLLVVSGSQVAALILGLRRVLPRVARFSWTGCAIECATLLGYCALSGAGNSIVRATVMAVAFSLAVRLDLGRGSANFLAAAGLVLLMLRPLDAPDPGAQMSFAATLALVVFAPPLAARLRRNGVPGLVAEALSATITASVAVTPIVLAHFHRVSVVSIPANLIAGPFAALLLYGSIATAALDAVWTPAAGVAGALCGAGAHALRWIAHHAAGLDPDWRGPALPLPLLATIFGPVVLSGWRRVAIPAAGLIAALTVTGLPAGDGRLHLWSLDVGQGDSILIETPGGQAAVIDAGPAFESFDAGERIVAEALWTLGHQSLAIMAVTHRHADHDGGAPFLARHFAPETIYTTAPSATVRASTTQASRGAEWTLDGVRFRVLAPDPAWPIPKRDENARSLVLEVVHGRSRFLLMGDAGASIERRLDLKGPRYDLVKAGHHGARDASTPEFARATRPRLVVISVGPRNRFGHPASGVLDTWTRAGSLVWRTDRDRTLHATSDGQGVSWEPPR